MDPKFRMALFGGTHLNTGENQDKKQGFQMGGSNPFNPPTEDISMDQSMNDTDSVMYSVQNNNEPPSLVDQLKNVLNLDDLPDSCSISMCEGGVIIKKKNILIDKEGSIDQATGERYQNVIKDDLEFGELIGQGNGGKVYKGHHKATGIPLAIKVVNLFDKEKRHQFYNEFDMIQSICPLLVRYYGAIFDEGSLNLIMEYMDCASIETMLAVERQCITPEETKTRPLIPELVISRFAWNILQGLQHLHCVKKQIHRDIKPDNILVESNMGLAKLSDFGISKKLSESSASHDETTKTYTGTLCYMSPERLQSMEYSYASDIWSLGVVIFEMVTGVHPFPQTDRAIEFHNHILNFEPPTLKGSPLVSIECADFVSRCLQKDPNERWRAIDLLQHPFIQFFISDPSMTEQHINWLMEYKNRMAMVKNKHMNTQIDIGALGIDAGLNSLM